MKNLYIARGDTASDEPRPTSGGPEPTFSRYHVAMFMEARYGLGMPWREIADKAGASSWGVRNAIRKAEAGYQYPEVTDRYVPLAWITANR